jgi:hypothetical protein
MAEFSIFLYEDQFVDYEQQSFMFALRLERGTYLPKIKLSESLRFRWGASVELSFSDRDRIPKRPSIFPRNDRTIGLTTSITPHIEYWPSENMFFDLGPSLAVWNFGYERSITENPALTERQQHRGGFYLDGLGFLARIGFGFKF